MGWVIIYILVILSKNSIGSHLGNNFSFSSIIIATPNGLSNVTSSKQILYIININDIKIWLF